MRFFLRVVAVCTCLILQYSKSNSAEFLYSSIGVFTNPKPVTAYFSGAETSQFKWGYPASFGGTSSSFTFTPRQNLNLNITSPISLGELIYSNNQTSLGSEATDVDFDVSIQSNDLIATLFKFRGSFGIITTPNNDSNSSDDVIVFPSSFVKELSGNTNQGFNLEILGFGTMNDLQGVTILSSLKIEENKSYSLQLIARVVAPIDSSQIVGLGDSVAAGYGLSYNDGDENSYPVRIESIWGSKKGYFVKNLAISGAISGNCEEHCSIKCQYYPTTDCKNNCMDGSVDPYMEPCHSVIENQLNEVLNMQPKIVTLTVGANDIDFVGCMEKWFREDMTSNNPMTNECWESNQKFKDRLDLLKQNLDEIFHLLAYTHSQVFITTYYNPFPKKDTKLCRPFYNPIAADAIYFKNYKIGSVPEVKEMATLYQNGTSAFVSTVLYKLNKVLADAAAPYSNVHVVSLNFDGHDFCKSSVSAWVYGPKIEAWYYLLGTRLSPKLLDYKKALPSECEFPPMQEKDPIVIKNNFFAGIKLYTNCMPHPTIKGQTAIAKAVVKSIKAQKIF